MYIFWKAVHTTLNRQAGKKGTIMENKMNQNKNQNQNQNGRYAIMK